MKNGFTLVETIVSIAIFVLIIGLVTGAILFVYKTQGYTKEESLAVGEARRGVDELVKEIREAQPGEDGSYSIERAADKEFAFYSDIDQDGKMERVRYYLGVINNGTQLQECVTYSSGGSCSVNFSNFFTGTLKSAQVKVYVEGDFGASNEYAAVFIDGTNFGDICNGGCSDCAGTWQGTTTYDVMDQAEDNSLQVLVDANSHVGNSCDWINYHHSMKVKAELLWSEEIIGAGNELKKGIIQPTETQPLQYPLDQETVSVITPYVRNAPPIFTYYDKDGNQIDLTPARLIDTKMMKIFLVVNIDPNRPPDEFQLESYVQIRNLKDD